MWSRPLLETIYHCSLLVSVAIGLISLYNAFQMRASTCRSTRAKNIKNVPIVRGHMRSLRMILVCSFLLYRLFSVLTCHQLCTWHTLYAIELHLDIIASCVKSVLIAHFSNCLMMTVHEDNHTIYGVSKLESRCWLLNEVSAISIQTSRLSDQCVVNMRFIISLRAVKNTKDIV